MSFTSAAIRFNRITALLITLVVLGGFLAYRSASRAEDPGFPVRTAMVQTFFPGASPERVEQLVTDKLEEQVMEMPELDFVSSMSKTGVSTLFVNIKESHKEHELRAIWDSLRRKIQAAEPTLPSGVVGPFVNDEFGDVFGIVLGLTGDGYTKAELKDVADEVRDELLRMSDVAKVEIFGSVEERIFIEIKNERIAEFGVSPAQLSRLLEAQNIVIPGGEIRSGSERYALEPSGNFRSVEAIGKTVMQLPGRKEVFRLSDVATVTRGYVEPAPREFRSSGTPGLGLALSMAEGGDIVQLGADVKEKLSDLESRYPLGIEIDVLIYQPDDVLRLVDNFVENLLQAVGIVMLAMVLFLGLRTGLIVASLIPSAIAAAFLIMGFFGIGVNQLSLASLIIALGLLVDNAVVMAESALVLLQEGKSRFEAAVESAKELGFPLLISSLTTSAAFLPIYLAESSTGEYTADLFKVVTITLLSSWVLSMTLTPLLCATFLKPGSTNKKGGLGDKFYSLYRKSVDSVLAHRAVFMAAMIVIFIVGVQGFKHIPNIFFPPSDNPSFIVNLEMPAGTAIEETREATARLERYLKEELLTDERGQSGVKHWVTYVGESGPRFYLSYVPDPPAPELAVLVISATDRTFAKKAVQRVRQFIAESLPDARATVEPRSLGPPASAPVAFEISGSEQDGVFALVDSVRTKMRDIAGTNNVRDDWGQRVKKLRVEIDPDRVLSAGLTNQDVAVSLQTALSGFEVTRYREDNDTIPVVLRSKEADRDDVDKLDSLTVSSLSGAGTSVPLKAVADITVVWEPSVIRRRDRQQSVSVKANLDQGYTSAEVNAQVIPWLKNQESDWDLGYRWRMGGEMEQAEKGNESINAKMPIGLLIIVMLLVSQFNSIRRASIILLTIPFSLVGVAAGLLFFKSYFGFMTLLGVYALFGIVINNAIVLIDRIDLELKKQPDDPVKAVLDASQRRLRPILLTTFTTVLGLIPLWLGGGPMWEPMAIAIIFGLLFSTVLTLGVVPVLYSAFFQVTRKPLIQGNPAASESQNK